MRVELHDDSIEPLLGEWEALFAVDPHATPPSSSPGWARAWWSHWSDGAQPWLLAVRREQELVGLAALARSRRGPLRTLKPLGGYVGNYWDVLTLPSAREAAVSAVAAEIVRRRSAWDVLLLDTLPEGSRTPAAFDDHATPLDQATRTTVDWFRAHPRATAV